MNYRTLAGTHMQVSEVGFSLGTLTTGRWGRFTDTEATALLHRALDLGINLYANADIDAEGRGEELLAKAFRQQREEIIVTVKVGYDFYHTQNRLNAEGKPELDFTPKYIRYAVDKALQRLKSDRIDVLQLHDVTLDAIHDQEVAGTLEELKRAGKILHYGMALGPGTGWRDEARSAITHHAPLVLEHLQNLLEPATGLDIAAEAYRQSDEEATDFQHGLMQAEPKPVSCFVRGCHASGLLTNKLTPETVFSPDDPRGELGRDWLRDGLKQAAQFNFLTGKDTGRTIAQAALLWLLAEPTVASCLPHIASREDLDEYGVVSEKNPLTADELQRVAELMAP